MKKSSEIIILFLSDILLAAFAVAGSTHLIRFIECFRAADQLPFVSEYPVMHVLVYGSSADSGGDTVSARISIMDTGGTEISVIERSWNGTALSVDFVSASFSGKKILFPFRVYGSRLSEGTKLAPYYMEHGRCFLLDTDASSSDLRNMYRLGRCVLSPAMRVFTRYTELYTVDLSGCTSGVYYTVYTGFDGRLFIKQD